MKNLFAACASISFLFVGMVTSPDVTARDGFNRARPSQSDLPIYQAQQIKTCSEGFEGAKVWSVVKAVVCVGCPSPHGQGIDEKHAYLGGANGPLGGATEEQRGAPHGGTCRRFRHGEICSHPEIYEAYGVWGSIYDRWTQLGHVEFGYPVSDEGPTGDGRGRYNHFRSMQTASRPESSIFWSPQTGAQLVYGAIRDGYRECHGVIGYPTNEEYQYGNSRRQDFERGHIIWSPTEGIQIFKRVGG